MRRALISFMMRRNPATCAAALSHASDATRRRSTETSAACPFVVRYRNSASFFVPAAGTVTPIM